MHFLPSIMLRILAANFFVTAVGFVAPLVSYATAPVTQSGLNTQVSESVITNGHIQHIITGGTRQGPNLFHSFGNFSVPTDNTVIFYNDTALPTDNILGRVTSGAISNILGTIQTTGFGNANLLLMNPSGIVFGPHATLNVGGSVTFTTADYIRLADNTRFTAGINPTSDTILSAAPITAFGFLGVNHGAINVQGSQITVAESKSLSLIGGDIKLGVGINTNGSSRAASVSAPGGQINIASVASRGELLADSLVTQPSTTMGSVLVSEETALNVSAEGAGTIRIRSGQLTISDSMLMANTGKQNGALQAIDIHVTGDLSLTKSHSGALVTAWSTGTGNSGEIVIQSENLAVSNSYSDPSFAPHAMIDSHTDGSGKAGDVTIVTQSLNVQNLSGIRSTGFTFIESGIRGDGQGGNVMVTAKDIILDHTTISTGDFFGASLLLQPTGSAGNLLITADHLQGTALNLNTGASAAFADGQQAGDITLHIHQIDLKDSQVSSNGVARGGAITFTGFHNLFTDFTLFETWAISGPGGGVTASGGSIDLTNGSKFVTTTFGNGNAGNITLTASDHVTLSGHSSSRPNPQSMFSPTGLFSNSIGTSFGMTGNAGEILITTPKLVMDTGGRINTITNSSGSGGNVAITADHVFISGEFHDPTYVIEGSIVDIGDFRPSGIFTRTIGTIDSCSGSCGVGGNIFIHSGSLNLSNGAQIDSGTSTAGRGGDITIHTVDIISLSGTLTDGSPVGIFSRTIGSTPDAGSGGNISLTAGQSVTIKDGATISASSIGTGDAGNISIHAGQRFDMQNGSVTTSAKHATGGGIDITATDLVRVVNGHISTSVLGGSGNGGNISIDPNVVVLQNSQIIAKAIAGAGGNITITTPVFLADQSSVVDASSQFGLNGSVTIQSPTSNLSGTISQLASKPSPIHALIQNRCAALAETQQSTFILSGRQAIPATPGGWVSSPFMIANGFDETSTPSTPFATETLELNEAPLLPVNLEGTGMFSLKSLTSPGFLVRSFALNKSAGCRL